MSKENYQPTQEEINNEEKKPSYSPEDVYAKLDEYKKLRLETPEQMTEAVYKEGILLLENLGNKNEAASLDRYKSINNRIAFVRELIHKFYYEKLAENLGSKENERIFYLDNILKQMEDILRQWVDEEQYGKQYYSNKSIHIQENALELFRIALEQTLKNEFKKE